MVGDRYELFTVEVGAFLSRAEHARLAWSVYVGIHQTDFSAGRFEGHGKV